MNDPSAQPIDINEQRDWLLEHKKSLALSWTDVSRKTGIPTGTISQFCGGSYAGDNVKLAEQVFRYRQTLVAQTRIAVELPEIPGYFETETSKQLERLLQIGQRGRVVVAAMGAGLGKSITARNYTACYTNVFMATMSPSTAGVNNMQIEVLEALGERDAVGTPQKLSRRIRAKVSNLSSPLLILDEAQHLSEKALEEIRSWNDACGVGIALFGNESVWQRLTGGSRQAHFAQLFSRVGLNIRRTLPLRGDIEALADAWRIDDERTVSYLAKICMTPGGLRGATYALEIASMIAVSNQRSLQVDDLQDAWNQLSSRPVAA